jgi:hypothetical protein
MVKDYVITKYQADNGDILPIKVLKATTEVTDNDAPSGAITVPQRAKVGGSRKGYGCHARGLNLYREVGGGGQGGTPPVRLTTFMPFLNTTSFNNPEFDEEGIVSLDGISWTVSSRRPERRK